MTEGEKLVELARYRLRQAEETCEEAEYLLAGGKSPRSVMNRVYYSMYYAVLALLIFEPYSSSKHSGVLSYFNRRFIKESLLPEALGRSLNKAFELRQRGDYREFADLSADQVRPFLDDARIFITEVKKYLLKKGV
ncbi:MAG: HEPN domain-containing protein [bacterium]